MTASAYRFLPDNPIAPLSMPRSQTVLIDPAGRDQATVLEVIEGVCRVYCPCEETEGMTLAFLQSGDRLRTDRLCSDGVCIEALTALKFRRDAVSTDELGLDAVNEWTLQLLRIRHLGQAEQRSACPDGAAGEPTRFSLPRCVPTSVSPHPRPLR